jgi:hypothetical protein
MDIKKVCGKSRYYFMVNFVMILKLQMMYWDILTTQKLITFYGKYLDYEKIKQTSGEYANTHHKRSCNPFPSLERKAKTKIYDRT